MSELFISDLSIYPVKSASQVALKSMSLNLKGPECDRRWMVVDQNNVVVTQRKTPKMCLIKVDIINNGIRLSVPGLPSCSVTRVESGDSLSSSVWGTDVQGIDCGDDVAFWLSNFLSKDCRLIYMPDNFHRAVDTNYAMQNETVGFADGFPLLIASQASLDDFNTKLAYDISMSRFRPNIVIGGSNAYAEDEWQTIAIGDIELSLVKPCSRCIMPSINPQTGIKEMVINEALQTYRRKGRSTYFGLNAVYTTLGEIKIGDEVRVIN